MSKGSKNNNSSLFKKVKESFFLFEESLNGSRESTIHALRRRALKKLAEHDFPTRRSEEYRYTNITRKLDSAIDVFELPKPAANQDGDFNISDLEGYFYYFTNGSFNKEKSHQGETDFDVAYQSNEDPITINSLEESLKGDDSFALLNSAFCSETLTIKIRSNISKPINIVHEMFGTQIIISQPRVLIQVDSGVEAIINEVHFTTGKKTNFSNTFTDIRIGKNAILTHIRSGLEEQNAVRVSTTIVHQEMDSTCTSINTDLGGEFVRNNLTIKQNGSGCTSNLYGLYALSGNMHVDNHTSVDHRHPHTVSNELYKGILTDNSTGVFNGKIFVRREAQKTNAFQRNNNILLSDDATINTKPQLEIWADDVKCSHGCTTGQLDKDQVFYLRTRGLSENQAKSMLLNAFAQEVLDKIPIPKLKELLNEKVLQVLGNE